MPERKVNTNDVSQIADAIETQNNKLVAELASCKSLFDTDLGRVYTGAAANETIAAFNSFYNKYAEEYKSSVTEYVAYLREHVVELNEMIERWNKQRAETISQ